MTDPICQNISQRTCQIECKRVWRLQQKKSKKSFSKLDKNATSIPINSKISIPQKMIENIRTSMSILCETNWNHKKSNQIKFSHNSSTTSKTSHKIQSMTFMSWKPQTLQNQKRGLRCPLRWSQKCLSTRNHKRVNGDDSRYPAISHKKMLCAKRQRVRFCRGKFRRYMKETSKIRWGKIDR